MVELTLMEGTRDVVSCCFRALYSKLVQRSNQRKISSSSLTHAPLSDDFKSVPYAEAGLSVAQGVTQIVIKLGLLDFVQVQAKSLILSKRVLLSR
jgi:hypothetical protein